MIKYIVEFNYQRHIFQLFTEDEPNTILYEGSEADCHFVAASQRAMDEYDLFHSQECEFDYV